MDNNLETHCLPAPKFSSTTAMLNKAFVEGWFDGNLVYPKGMDEIIQSLSKMTDYFYEFTYDIAPPVIIEANSLLISEYLFAKGVEGLISLGPELDRDFYFCFTTAHLTEFETLLPAHLHIMTEQTKRTGANLYQAFHNYIIETRGEFIVTKEEVHELFTWMPLLGFAYGFKLGYYLL